jgi:hypothetical protein
MLMPNSTKTVKYIHRFLNTHIPLCFINKVEEYNAILGQQQLENIHNTILLIDNRHNSDKIDSLLQTNVQKCMQWCVKHGQTHNIIVMNTNVFLSVT